MEEHISFFFDHNIVYYDRGELLGSNWKDAKKHDFRLKPESPALKLGFKQIDVSNVGPRYTVGPTR